MTVTLFHTAGQDELELITKDGFRRFPPEICQDCGRPAVFYPEPRRDHAVQIARDWTTRDSRSAFTGYLLRCQVEAQTGEYAGDSDIWLGQDGLAKLNQSLVGLIEVEARFVRADAFPRT